MHLKSYYPLITISRVMLTKKDLCRASALARELNYIYEKMLIIVFYFIFTGLASLFKKEDDYNLTP